MMEDPLLEQKVTKALGEVERACRAQSDRCSAIADLAASGDPMSSLARRVRTTLSHIDMAVSSMALMRGAGLSLKLEDRGGRSRIVVKCVDNMLDGLDEPGSVDDCCEGDGPVGSGLHGSTSVISVPQLLDFLCFLDKTGVLEVKALYETFRVGFKEGELLYAVSSNSPEGKRIGDILVARGAIDLPRLEALVRSVKKSGQLLGEAIRDAKYVTEEELRSALEVQSRDVFGRLYDVEDATFHFREGSGPAVQHCARLNVRRLLLETAMRDGAAEDIAREAS